MPKHIKKSQTRTINGGGKARRGGTGKPRGRLNVKELNPYSHLGPVWPFKDSRKKKIPSF